MLALNAADNIPLPGWTLDQTEVLVVTTNPAYVSALRSRVALLLSAGMKDLPDGFGLVLLRGEASISGLSHPNVLKLSAKLQYLSDGDVIRVAVDGKMSVLYRRSASFNAFLVTERCNSFCVMCSQPPREIDDSHRVDDLMRAIPLIDGAREICITGGEPALLGDRFLCLVRALKSYLPFTAVHVLSNGRYFKSLDLAVQLAAIKHHDLMIGIPLYSDISTLHDFVVQADGAYDETIQGIMNLKRCGVRVEIRVVIHRHTFERLPQLARFIARNLQFVDKVALMGLEVTGFAKSNLSELWIDPVEYADQLAAAVNEFERSAVKVAVYNHQLCTVSPQVRRFAVPSISDWKREYLDVCSGCDARSQCGGVFGTSGGKYSSHIRPITAQVA